jgi:hypothetical protein
MPLQSDFPVPIPLALSIRIIQGSDIRTGHAQALIRLIDFYHLDLPRGAIANANRRFAAKMRSTAINLDQHLRLVAIDTPGESRFTGELIAGSLVEAKDRGRLGIEAPLEQDLAFRLLVTRIMPKNKKVK